MRHMVCFFYHFGPIFSDRFFELSNGFIYRFTGGGYDNIYRLVLPILSIF